MNYRTKRRDSNQPPIIPRYYQQEAIDKTIDVLSDINTKGTIVAMPTGTGKSVVIAFTIKHIIENSNGEANILMLTHSAKLVAQNAATMRKVAPNIPVGICCSSLQKFYMKEFYNPVIFGTIQSFKSKQTNRVKLLYRPITHILIDECHLVSFHADTQYYQLVKDLEEQHRNKYKPTGQITKTRDQATTITGDQATTTTGDQLDNPLPQVIGYSATPYKTKQAVPKEMRGNFNHKENIPMTRHPFFTNQAIDICSNEYISKLIDDGFLCKLTTDNLHHPSYDTGSIAIDHKTGDFKKKELNIVVEQEDINEVCVADIIEKGQERKFWIIFTCSIKHTKVVANIFKKHGITTKYVHSKMAKEEVNTTLIEFKEGKYRCLVNCDMLTTGYDNPAIDLIALLRPTQVLSLFIQMAGRGTRPYQTADQTEEPYTKQNCLLLDYGGNIERHGAFDLSLIERTDEDKEQPQQPQVKPTEEYKKEKPKDNLLPSNREYFKVCHKCGYQNPVRTDFCHECHTFLINITNTASNRPIMLIDEDNKKKYLLAKGVQIQKGSRIKTIRIKFLTEAGMYSLYLLFDTKAQIFRSRRLWSVLTSGKQPNATYELIELYVKDTISMIEEKGIYISLQERINSNDGSKYYSVVDVRKEKF